MHDTGEAGDPHTSTHGPVAHERGASAHRQGPPFEASLAWLRARTKRSSGLWAMLWLQPGLHAPTSANQMKAPGLQSPHKKLARGTMHIPHTRAYSKLLPVTKVSEYDNSVIQNRICSPDCRPVPRHIFLACPRRGRLHVRTTGSPSQPPQADV